MSFRERFESLRADLEPEESWRGGELELQDHSAHEATSLLQELERKKLMFLAAQAQLSFITLISGELKGLDHNAAELRAADLLRAARARNEALELELHGATKNHEQLRKALAAAKRDANRLQSQCKEELEEVESLLAEEEAEAEQQAFSEAHEGLHGSLEAWQSLDYEQKCLDYHRQQPQDMLDELPRLESQEQAEVASLEAMCAQELELGLPRICFDDVKGFVQLGGPAARAADPGLLTVKVHHDDVGRLLQAETHPALGLGNDCVTSVESNDLARLLTLVWDRAVSIAPGPMPLLMG